MEDLFKGTTCDEESQNPVLNILSSMMSSNPAQHYYHESLNQEFLDDAWEEGELFQNHADSNWQEEVAEELWNHVADPQQLDFAWEESAMKADVEDYEKSEEIEDYLKEWNQEKVKNYSFTRDNKFSDYENCYELSIQKEKSGETDEAILLLEIEVQKHPDHSEAWSLLGKLHAKNDDDTKAISAMLRGLEVDPYNLDLLLSLGISCTNELDQDQALSYLKTWIQHHPLYSDIPVSESNLKEDIIEAFKVASSINNSDSDVFQALGVLNYLSSDFETAEQNFRAALYLRQDDAAIWNRLGASLAKQEKTAEAFECYHKSLEIRPDYVRTWGNLGLAYATIKDYESCARFYLCALSLNPNATHIYNYLTSAFIMMNRYDLLEKLSTKDPSVFSNEFQIISRAQLPRSANWEEEFN